MGESVKIIGLPIGPVISSPHRARQTAELAFGGCSELSRPYSYRRLQRRHE